MPTVVTPMWRPVSIEAMRMVFSKTPRILAFSPPIQQALVWHAEDLVKNPHQDHHWNRLARPHTILRVQSNWINSLIADDFPSRVTGFKLNRLNPVVAQWGAWMAQMFDDLASASEAPFPGINDPLTKEEIATLVSLGYGLHFRFWPMLEQGEPLYLGNIVEIQPDLLFPLPKF